MDLTYKAHMSGPPMYYLYILSPHFGLLLPLPQKRSMVALPPRVSSNPPPFGRVRAAAVGMLCLLLRP